LSPLACAKSIQILILIVKYVPHTR